MLDTSEQRSGLPARCSPWIARSISSTCWPDRRRRWASVRWPSGPICCGHRAPAAAQPAASWLRAPRRVTEALCRHCSAGSSIEDEAECVVLRPPGGGSGLSFQTEVGYAPPVWTAGPGQQKMRMHLDLPVAIWTPRACVHASQHRSTISYRDGVALSVPRGPIACAPVRRPSRAHGDSGLSRRGSRRRHARGALWR